MSTRRMTRFTLGAWLGRRNRDDTPPHVGDLVKLPLYHDDSRVCTECLDNSSHRDTLEIYISLYFLYISSSSSDSSSDVTKNGFTLLVRGHAPECLEFLDRVLKLVQVRGNVVYFTVRTPLFARVMARCWGKSKLDNDTRRGWLSFCRDEWTFLKRYLCTVLSPRARSTRSYLWAASRWARSIWFLLILL